MLTLDMTAAINGLFLLLLGSGGAWIIRTLIRIDKKLDSLEARFLVHEQYERERFSGLQHQLDRVKTWSAQRPMTP